MKPILTIIRISALSFVILFLLLFVVGVTIISAAQITDLKFEPAVTSLTEKLKVHFIDVGNGDSILIDFGEKEILIDGGLTSSNVSTYLKDYVDGSLDAMVATHPHPDHIGGLINVLKTFDVDEIYLNGDVVSRKFPFFKIYEKFIKLVKAEGAIVHEARRGQIIDISILSFHVIHPDRLISYGSSQGTSSILRTMNNNSIVLRIRYGNISFLFTGDVHIEAETDILKTGSDVRADILKVGGHGVIRSSSPQFRKAVMPKIAIYMAGGKIPKKGPKKPHPHIVAAFQKAGAAVYGTNTHGHIIITTDGKTYTIVTEK
jgi:competence protein ComEC